MFTALGEQTAVVVGTGAAGIVLPKLAEQLLSLRRQHDEITAQVEALVEAHPHHEVLTSIPAAVSGPAPGSSPKSPASTSRPPPTSATEPVTKTRVPGSCPQRLDDNHRGSPKSPQFAVSGRCLQCIQHPLRILSGHAQRARRIQYAVIYALAGPTTNCWLCSVRCGESP